jgi:AcrR family transcriptional regulator
MGVTERKEREKEQRRQEIISAAEKVFFKKGVDTATMDDVAEQAELSKATLYLYFTSKEEIYSAIFSKSQEALFKMIDKATVKATGTREKIAAFLSAFISFQKKNPDYFEAFSYFLTKDIEIDEQNCYVKQRKESGQEFLSNWVKLVQKGKDEGLIRENLNEIPVALILWMQLIGFLKIYPKLKNHMNKEFNVTEEGILADYFELIFNGMIKK